MKLENVKLLMQQKVSLYCNEKNFISHGKLLAKAKRIIASNELLISLLKILIIIIILENKII